MKCLIAVCGLLVLWLAASASGVTSSLTNPIGDPESGLHKYLEPKLAEEAELDLEEDPTDRFVTSRSGKARPRSGPMPKEDEDWGNDKPLALGANRVLKRHKRCGDDDDDGGANRARGVRGGRRRRRRGHRRSRRARVSREQSSNGEVELVNTKGTKKTVTRRVIKDGQVVSETKTQADSGSQAAAVSVAQNQPAQLATTVTQPQAAQQLTVAQNQPAQQLTVHQSQPAQQLAVPQIQPAQLATTMTQPQVVQQPAVPSVQVQNSVKVN